MKIAFVHDWIVNFGGAENVLKNLIENEDFKEAKIFTVFSTHKNITINGKNMEIIPVISNDFLINKIDFRNLLPFFPVLTRILTNKIRTYSPDKIVISSFAIAKNINQKKFGENQPTTKLYLHSPMQYVRDSYEEYINKLSFIKKIPFWLATKYLRYRDKKYNSFDEVIFNSEYTKSLSHKIYGMQGKISYPSIESFIINHPVSNDSYNYYIFMGRLVVFSKELDKVIKLFNKTKDNLIIAGSGPDEFYLKSIAETNITFVHHIEDVYEKIQLLTKSKGVINLTKESFGIVTAEALALGVPVFGYNQGATKELVDKNSGILVDQKDQKTLQKQFEKFKSMSFNRERIKQNFLTKYLNT